MQTKQHLNILRSSCKSSSNQSLLKRGKVITCLIGIMLALMAGKGTAQPPSCNVNIPDANFKNYLLGEVTINTNSDGEIQCSEAAAFTGGINVAYLGLTDLTGIETFTALTYLSCHYNSLTSLDVSANTALINLYCGGNSLTSIDVSANTALNELYCNNNSLTSLDVSANTALTELDCYGNTLTSLDVSANTALTYLYCGGNSLTSLDLSANPALTQLSCHHNSLTSLNVSANTALIYLYCPNNSLTNLNIANGNNANLTMIADGNANLTCIQVDNVANANAYTDVTFYKDAVASYSTNCSPPCTINIPDASFKTYLLAQSAINTNNDSEIQCSEAAAFTGAINVFGLGINDLTGIASFTTLTQLNCASNYLTSLDVSANTALTYLSCHYNILTTLNVSANTALTYLLCRNNSLTSIDVSANTALTQLNCEYNSLTSLDVLANTALTNLYCSNNSLTSLDVSANTALTELSCTYNNSLTSLNIANGNNANLTMFADYGNANLTCIQVDNVANANAYTGVTFYKDAGAGYSTNCTAISWYLDADNDGYYVSTTQSVNSPGAGYTSTLPANGQGDCNDNDVNVFALPTAQTITASGATTFCAGGSVTLSGNNGGVWSTGATSATIGVITNGDYYVTNTNSCGSVESNHTIVNVNQNPSPVITGGASFCINNSATLNAGSGFTSYLWNNGSTAQNLLITQPGSYGVTVTNASNCSAFGSIAISPCASSVPETRLRSVDCGKINLIPSAQIACNIVSGASNYEWEFRSISTNAVYATRITSSYIIAPFMVTPTLQWNTQYNCRVRAKVGGVWGNYGTSCVMGLMQNPAITGVPATTIRPQFCNVTNLALTTTIACQSVSMWSLYQYEFTDVLTNQVIIKQIGSIYLVLNTVAPALLPGRTYQVRVRGYVYNTWSAWSAACSIGISSGISAREISISTDADGNETIVENEITMDASINESIFKLSVYPNPFNQQATMFIQSSKSDKAQVQIFDMVGNLVWNEQVNTNTNVTIGNDFATGTYIVKVLNENGEQAIHRMIKTN